MYTHTGIKNISRCRLHPDALQSAKFGCRRVGRRFARLPRRCKPLSRAKHMQICGIIAMRLGSKLVCPPSTAPGAAHRPYDPRTISSRTMHRLPLPSSTTQNDVTQLLFLDYNDSSYRISPIKVMVNRFPYQAYVSNMDPVPRLY